MRGAVSGALRVELVRTPPLPYRVPLCWATTHINHATASCVRDTGLHMCPPRQGGMKDTGLLCDISLIGGRIHAPRRESASRLCDRTPDSFVSGVCRNT